MQDFTWGVIEKSLEGLTQRLHTSSQNLANINTPRYARRETYFEEQLRAVIDGPTMLPVSMTNNNHIPNVNLDVSKVKPVEAKIPNEVYRLDLNNVDPETEMARLNETRMMYQAMTQIVTGKISKMKYVIAGR